MKEVRICVFFVPLIISVIIFLHFTRYRIFSINNVSHKKIINTNKGSGLEVRIRKKSLFSWPTRTTIIIIITLEGMYK